MMRNSWLSGGETPPRTNILVVAVVSLLGIFTIQSAAASSGEVNVYSARKEALIKPLLDRFTEETGIKTNLVTGKAAELLKRLELEGSASPADLFITVDAGRLQRAKVAKVLQTVQSDTLLRTIPEHLRDADNQWFGLSQRARTIFYVHSEVDPSELSTYEALTDPKWRARICIRSSNNIYNQSLVASMIEANGAEATEQWARGLVDNFARPPAGGDTDQLKAAAAGVCDLAIANTYYFGRLLNSDDADLRAVTERLRVFWPNQDDRGAHVNVSGAGVTAHAKNRENAVQLLEFLVSDDSQRWYAEVNNEYPVAAGAEIPAALAKMGAFKADAVNLTRLGENNRQAVEIMDRAGWK